MYYLQIYTDKYILNAFNTSIKQEIVIPERGAIFDRNEKLLVFNKPIYELNVIPILVDENLNVIEFCSLIGMEKNDFFKNLEKAKLYSKYLPSVFTSFISKEKFANIQEKLYKYKGFDWTKRSIRDYKINSSINVLGYIGEVTTKDIRRESNYYQMGDFMGLAGIEKSCEKILRGKKGVNYWIRDRKGCIIGEYNNKKNNIQAISGNDISLTIDWNLQKYAEQLMYQKKGGIVAIDPKNGEILSLVSSPMSDPNLFSGSNRSKEFQKLMNNTIDNPLLDRTTQARYPPASSFKLLIELAGLQMGVVQNDTTFTCYHGFRYHGKRRIRCHSGIHGIPIGLGTAISVSCNNYFAQVYKRIIEKYPKNLTKGANEWCDIVKSFGFGNHFSSDLSTKENGVIPSGDYYNKKYGKKKWNAITIISNSIGQGEIIVTPIQLANMVCAIANKGFFYTPHLVKRINHKIVEYYNNPNYTKVKKKYFDFIIHAMEKVFFIGTGKHFKSYEIQMAGKTGTSQNFIRINHKKMVSLPDHSIFVLFAPVKNPKIAVSVIIENGGFGSNWAGPIASLIAEKYIKKIIRRKNLEEKMINSGLEKVYSNIEKMKKLKSFYENHKKT
ncbi:penicillin-binding protein 2 [Blattabacterium cuenoti]|uniref:penicillin-binding protein 2 n=1 Tax=Blattabacterium cuenoti TaxID=1653831 RepID=UPI00374D7A56